MCGNKLQVCDNGVISFGGRFKIWRQQLFPSASRLISQSNILAVFWNDHRPSVGNISYQIFENGGSDDINNVNTFVRKQGGEPSFNGTWMIAISWENVFLFIPGLVSCLSHTYMV